MIMLKNGTFRIYKNEYSKHHSTVFDLVDGIDETKQTKGLAYVLSREPMFLQKFIKKEEITVAIKKLIADYSIEYSDILNSDKYRVDAEMMSCDPKNQLRRDITISFYKEGKKILVLVIEAKNISLGSVNGVDEQLESYFDSTLFPFEENVPKLGITLTKYRQIISHGKM